jgi:hypothetical protein
MMVLCQILGVIVGVALLCLLNIDAELGQITIVVVVVFVVNNRDTIAIIVVLTNQGGG